MHPIRVGLIGTGYAAKARAESLQSDPRWRLVAVAGRTLEKTSAFCDAYGAAAMPVWMELINRSDLDLVIIAATNRDHGPMVRAALHAGKHVVVEYPLALDWSEAEALIQLAQQQNKLLHVEHIELLSGIHLAVKACLPMIGQPFYARYLSLNAQHPAPTKWTYSRKQFGFPFMGAVSRIHRLTDLLGQVTTVSCQARWWDSPGSGDQFTACLCTAQLRFASGTVAEVVYGKGEAIWQSSRTLDIHGEQGGIFVEGEQGKLVQAEQTQALDTGSRRGLFAKDTGMVLDALLNGAPLYVSLQSSLYALKVADAARRSAEIGQMVEVV